MTDPKIDSVLDEANRLFLEGKLAQAISYYDRILTDDPGHLPSLNNKGYAQSKLGLLDEAIKCYDLALQTYPDDLSVLVNKTSSLRKKGNLAEALSLCDRILDTSPRYNAALYHKERILFSMEKFAESIRCCDMILEDYPDSGDVSFDKSCGLAMLSRNDDALDVLEHAILQGPQYVAKAKKSKSFEKLSGNPRFRRLVSAV